MERRRGDVDRRSIVSWILGGTGGALFLSVVYPIFRFISPPRIPEATTNQVAAGTTTDPEYLDKGYKIVRFGSEPVIVVRVSPTEYRAFAATCTHLDCIVEYRKEKSAIWCNCHNGEYDLNGKNVSGPPPRPLAAYTLNLVDPGDGRPADIFVSRT
jgi:Rieske Fe-S protein